MGLRQGARQGPISLAGSCPEKAAEFSDQGIIRLRPVLRVLGQAPSDNAPLRACEWTWLRLEADLHQLLRRAVPAEVVGIVPSAQELICNDPDRVDIGTMVNVGCEELFGRHVGRRPCDRINLDVQALPLRRRKPRKSEVADLRVPEAVNEDVPRLNVAMRQETLPLRVLQTLADLGDEGKAVDAPTRRRSRRTWRVPAPSSPAAMNSSARARRPLNVSARRAETT